MKLNSGKYSVELDIDSTYTVDSADNKYYDKVLNPEELSRNDFYVCLKIIAYTRNGKKTAMLILSNCAGGSPSALLEDNILIVLCNSFIYKLSLDSLEIVFRRDLELFGCTFDIFSIDNGYIIYGELEIAAIDKNFNKQWDFSGRDIFVSTDNRSCFEMKKDRICLYDWQNNYYEVSFDGRLINE